MGRVNRERIARIEAGLEISIADKVRLAQGDRPKAPAVQMLFCWMCEKPVAAKDTRAHIESCWHVTLRADEPVPMMRNKLALLMWLKRRTIIKKEAPYERREATAAL